MNDGYLLEW